MSAVATARERATAETFLRLEPMLEPQRREELDGLLVAGEDLRISRLAWLHRGATTASPMAIRAELDKLRFLRELDAYTLDLSVLPEARRRRLRESGGGRRIRPWPAVTRTSGIRGFWRPSPSAPSKCSMRWSACSTRRCRTRRTAPSASWMTCWPGERGSPRTG